jgi:hypothetical protein
MLVMPVMLPPGLLRLSTNPSATGSLPIANTTGMVGVDVAVADLATWTAEVPSAAKRSMRSPTSSAAKAGSRS